MGMRLDQRGDVFQCDTRQYIHCLHVTDTQNNTWTFIIGKHTWLLLFSPLDGAAMSVDLCTMAGSKFFIPSMIAGTLAVIG